VETLTDSEVAILLQDDAIRIATLLFYAGCILGKM